MKKVTRYQCDYCGETFASEEDCLKHEDKHSRISLANTMLEQGATLREIQDKCCIWYNLPEYCNTITKDSYFKIPYLQCCNQPAYHITRINMDGRVSVWGCGSWAGYYGASFEVHSNYFRDPRPKEEAFSDPRYEQRIKEHW